MLECYENTNEVICISSSIWTNPKAQTRINTDDTVKPTAS